MKKTGTLFFRFLLAGTLVFMAQFPNNGAMAAEQTIKLGIAGPHSGDLASYGIPSSRAAELVVMQVNANGGVLGKTVQMIGEDDVCKPEIAANIATKLVSENVDVVLGHICSGATKAAIGIYKDSKKIVMSPSATTPELTLSGNYPNFFRTIGHDLKQGDTQVDFAVSKLKLTKFAILHDKGEYGKGIAEYVNSSLKKNGKTQVLLYEGITPGAVDYSAVVQKIKRSGAEAVIFGGYHPEASKIVTQMRKKKIDIPFISDDGVKDDTFIKVAGKYAEGVYATGPSDTSKNPIAAAAIDAHKKAFGAEPGAFFLNAYAAAQALLNAIEKAGSTEYAAVAKALRTYDVDTPLGKIKFDDKGDAIGVGFSMYQVKEGAYVELK